MPNVETDPRSCFFKECIVCDGCGTDNPPMRCATCHLTYYCHETCGKNHWQVHKSQCKSLEELRNQYAGLATITKTKIVNDDDDDDVPTHNCCSICNKNNETESKTETETCTLLVLGGCGHTFCFRCLQHYQIYGTPSNNTSCPTCHLEKSMDPHHQALTRAAICLCRAAGLAPNQRDRDCQSALNEIEMVQDQNSSNLAAKIMYGEVLDLLGQPDLSLTLLSESLDKLKKGTVQANAKAQIDNLMEQVQACIVKGDSAGAEQRLDQIQQLRNQKYYSTAVQISDVVDLTLRLGLIQEHAQDYPGAKLTYKLILKDYPRDDQLNPLQHLLIYMGVSRCLLKEGDLDGAIEMGGAAIQLNRHYPRVHDTIIQAYQSKGELQEAMNVPTRAALYETPWDAHNLKHVNGVYVLLKDLVQQQIEM